MNEVINNGLATIGSGAAVGILWVIQILFSKYKNGNGKNKIAQHDKDINNIKEDLKEIKAENLNGFLRIEKAIEKMEENNKYQYEWMRGHVVKIYDNLGENREKVAKIEGRIEK